MESLERAVVWRNLLTGGSEYFELLRKGNCHILRGKVVSVLEPAEPLFISYEIVCDDEWQTREARILQVNAGEQSELKIDVRQLRDGVKRPVRSARPVGMEKKIVR